jgi:Bromodomain.
MNPKSDIVGGGKLPTLLPVISPDQQNTFRPYEKAYDKHGVLGLRETATGKFYYNLEIVTIEKRLANGYYKRAIDFVADVKRMVKDARQTGDPERILRSSELLTNVEVDIAGVLVAEPALMAECEQVYLREMAREKEAAEREKRAQVENAAPIPDPSNESHGNTESGLSTGPIQLGEEFPDNEDDRKAALHPVTPTSQFKSFANGDHHDGVRISTRLVPMLSERATVPMEMETATFHVQF